MKKGVFLAAALTCMVITASSQTPVDTTVFLQRIDVKGRNFTGLRIGEVKCLNVDNNLTGIAVTAVEAFRQLPSVTTDIEGGVFFRGSSRSYMLVNGVPYGLLEEYNGDVLIQLPAIFFDRLSLHSYPPIEWVPDGDVGTFNLASTVYTRQDAPVTATLGAGPEERYNAGVILNLHPGRWHINAKYNYRHEFRERRFFKSTATSTGTTEMNNTASARPDIHIADLSVGYDLTPSDRLTAYGLYYLMDYNRYGAINNTRYNPAGEVMNRMLRHRFNYQRQDAYTAELRWSHLFANQQDRLELLANYNNFGYDEDNDFKNENPQGAIVAQDNLFIQQTKDNYYLSAIYSKLLGDGSHLRAGYTGRFRDEQYNAEANDLKQENWVPNLSKSNLFDFRRSINTLFLSWEKTFGRLSGEAGVQAEYSHQVANEEANNAFHLYPRVRLSYQADDAGKLQFTYLQRAIRPYGVDLNPFIDRADATHLKQGNPDLRDEFIHSLELAWAVDLSRVRLAPAIYYRYRTNRIMEVVSGINDISVWQKINLGNSQTIGGEIALHWYPASFLSVGFSGDIYRDEIDGRAAGYGEKKSLVCWDMKGFVSVTITPDTELQLDGFYVSDQLTPQGKVKSRSSVNAGLSQYFMHRKLRANLSVNDLFDGLEEVTAIDSDAIRMEQVRGRDARVTWLTLTYSF